MNKAGLDCEDPKLKKVLALATQKFVTDIATDAMQHSRVRTGGSGSSKGEKRRDKKVTLTVEDLGAALSEYGINLKRPPYFIN